MVYKRVIKKRLGELLIEGGVITRDQLERALSSQKETEKLLGETLVDMRLAKETDIAGVVAVQYGIPYLPLKQHDIDVSLLKLLPKEVAIRYRCFPVDMVGAVLTIAIENPLDDKAQEEIRKAVGCKVLCYVSTMSEIVAAINEHYKKVEIEVSLKEEPRAVEAEDSIQVFQLENNDSSKE